MNRIWIIVAVVIGVYLALGACTMSMAQESLRGKEGAVWNQNARAIEVLGRLEKQVSAFMADRQEVVAQITEARAGMQNAAKSRDLVELDQAQRLLGSAINVIFEAYPDLSLSVQQTALMDETAGSINRIVYARQELMNAQVGYNQSRIFFFPLQMMYPRQQVVGEGFDAMAPLPASTFGEKQ